MRFFSPSQPADPSNGLHLRFSGTSNPVLFIPIPDSKALNWLRWLIRSASIVRIVIPRLPAYLEI